MRQAAVLCVMVLMVGGVAGTLGAQSAADSSTADSSTAARSESASASDARVQSLLQMAPAERRAALKAMAPEERRGLWYALKRAQARKRGSEPARDYAERAKGESSRRATPSGEGAGRRGEAESLAVGSITYDDGVISTSFGGGALVGNRFDTHTSIPVFTSGTVSTVQAVVVQGATFTTSSAGFVLLGPQTGGGGAMAIFSTFTTATGTTDTVTFTGIGANYTANSFFVLFGDFAQSYVPAFGTGSTNGQGFHGVVGYTGGMGPNITGTFNLGGALNGLVRATGNIVPVELMSFDVE